MSNAGQVVPTEVWADTSAQLDCESAPAFGLPQCCGALSSWHPLPYSWNLLPFYPDGSSHTYSFNEGLPGPQMWALFFGLRSFEQALCIFCTVPLGLEG